MKRSELEHSRWRPNRLTPDHYRIPWQAVGYAICTKDRRGSLISRGVPDLLVSSLDTSAANHGCKVFCYCIMPDHLHLIACVVEEGADLQPFVAGFKQWTARRLGEMGFSKPVWQRGYWDRHVREDESVGELVAYVLGNPVREGLCKQPEDWAHSELRPYPWA